MTGTRTSADEATFEHERGRLVGLAYRITGSRAAAEDLVQEAWLRWDGTDRDAIVDPAAWLTTVTSRLALDHLKSAQQTREAYVGPWLPELATAEPDPAEHVELAESVTIGFLAVLERLGPTERVVFLLADVFRLPFEEIAPVVDRSVEACRQIASRARARIREGRPRFAPTDEEAWQVATAFLIAAQVGDLDSLVALLAPDALAISDGGADHHAARRPVVAERVPRFIVNLAGRVAPDASITPETINGQPGLVVWDGDTPQLALAVAVAEGRVQRVWTVLNPEKLATLGTPPIP